MDSIGMPTGLMAGVAMATGLMALAGAKGQTEADVGRLMEAETHRLMEAD